MKKEKIIIVAIVTLLILMIVIIGIIVKINKPKQQEKNSTLATPEVIVEVEKQKNLAEVTSRSDFYVVKSSIENFYNCYSELYKDPLYDYKIEPEEGTVDIEKIKTSRREKIYSMLDEKYLEHKGITIQNLEKQLIKIEDTTINIEHMYYAENDSNISVYFVYGSKKELSASKATSFSLMVKIDFENKTFKILLDDYVQEFYKDLNIGQYIEIANERIKDDTYNKFTYKNISESDYLSDLFKHYKNSIRLNKEKSYELIDASYKEKAFSSIEQYLTYIDANYMKLLSTMLEAYNKEDKGEYVQYLYEDTRGNYYIFKETAPFKYTILLDNYIIPTEDFEKEYSGLNDSEKAMVNVKKFFKAIDDKNYGYSYNVLSEAFKTNKYPNIKDFENFAKQNFYEKNEVDSIDYQKENGLYICKITLKDATGKSTEQRIFNIIVKLNSGTDFEMSFGQ